MGLKSLKIFAFSRGFAALALISAAGCMATTAPPDPVVHTSVIETPTVLSRMAIAQDYDFHPAPALAAHDGADPSFALPHETPSLAFENMFFPARIGDVVDTPSQFLRADASLPEGWTWSAQQTALHVKSGLDCPLSLELPEESRRFTLTELMVVDSHGLDVGCNYSTGQGAALTLYASFWPEMSLEDSIGGAVEAILQRFPVKGAMPVQMATLADETGNPAIDGLEESKATSFDIGDVAGTPYKTSLWLVKTHGWHVKARATYPQADATSELVAAIMHAISHVKVRSKNLTDPTPTGAEV